MEILAPGYDLEAFFKALASSSHALLILDYDGTLAPFTEDPSKAAPYEGVLERLQRLMEASEVVIMSGRRLDSLKQLLRLPHLPELWGCHGGERLKMGANKISRYILPPDVIEVIARAAEAVAKLAPHLTCEIKPLSVAMHWRGKSSEIAEKERMLVLDEWSRLMIGQPVEIHPFEQGAEFRPKGVNKGEAVKMLLKERSSNAVVAYLGDDFTDEEAFAALGQRGLKVLVRKNIRRTCANIRLDPPEELFWFLDRWIKEKA